MNKKNLGQKNLLIQGKNLRKKTVSWIIWLKKKSLYLKKDVREKQVKETRSKCPLKTTNQVVTLDILGSFLYG